MQENLDVLNLIIFLLWLELMMLGFKINDHNFLLKVYKMFLIKKTKNINKHYLLQGLLNSIVNC